LNGHTDTEKMVRLFGGSSREYWTMGETLIQWHSERT